MNMFSKAAPNPSGPTSNVSSLHYRSTNESPLEVFEVDEQEVPDEPEVTLTERSLSDRLAAERAQGFAAAEAALRREFEEKMEVGNGKILKTIADFEKAQKAYFARVEAEVVQLALAIAGKILHREAQVDPMLLSAIVHLALGQLKEGSSASIRVLPAQANRWREHLASLAMKLEVKVIEDADLERGDCVLETELGSVNFSLDAQLKEVERGFFDVLAQKPQI
jgi:flagellar assembly protein FliH